MLQRKQHMPTLFGLQTNRSIIQGSENYSTGICSSESEVLCCSRIAFSSSRSTESAKQINEISCITGLAMSGRIAVKANVLALRNPACQWPQQNLSCCSLRHAAPCFLTQRWDQRLITPAKKKPFVHGQDVWRNENKV